MKGREEMRGTEGERTRSSIRLELSLSEGSCSVDGRFTCKVFIQKQVESQFPNEEDEERGRRKEGQRGEGRSLDVRGALAAASSKATAAREKNRVAEKSILKLEVEGRRGWRWVATKRERGEGFMILRSGKVSRREALLTTRLLMFSFEGCYGSQPRV